jgi:guanylate kinase
MKNKLIVEERMKQFDKDLLHWKKYDFAAINDDLETCYYQIVEIIKAKLNQTTINYDQKLIDDHIKKLIQ